MIALVAGEWFKLRRRLLPYILLAVLVLIAQAFLWGFYIAHHVGSSETTDFFTMPTSFQRAIDSTFNSYFAPILIMILAASSFGVEYGLGTLRSSIAKGPGRPNYLLAKVLTPLLLGMVAVLILTLSVALASVLATLLSDKVALPASPDWSETASLVLRSAYALFPYIAVGTFFVVLTQSTAQGVTLSIVFVVLETFTLAPLLSLNDSLAAVSDYLLSANLSTFLSEEPTALSFLLLTAYGAVPYAVSMRIFTRRDIGGPRGE